MRPSLGWIPGRGPAPPEAHGDEVGARLPHERDLERQDVRGPYLHRVVSHEHAELSGE
jgi:hypothetical protein